VPVPVADVPCSSEFLLENVHYMRGPSGEMGCVGDVVASAGSAHALEVSAVRFDRMESATLVDSDLYLNGSGSIRSSDPLASETSSSASRFKRLTVIIRSNGIARDAPETEPEQPAPRQIPRLRPIGQGRMQWPRMSLRAQNSPRRAAASSRHGRVVVTEESWGKRATSATLSGCLSLAEQVQRAKRGSARLRLSNYNDYKTSRFAVVQYHNESGAAVILNRVQAFGSGDGITCSADFAED